MHSTVYCCVKNYHPFSILHRHPFLITWLQKRGVLDPLPGSHRHKQGFGQACGPHLVLKILLAAPLGSWQNSLPCSCTTAVPISLWAVSQGCSELLESASNRRAVENILICPRPAVFLPHASPYFRELTWLGQVSLPMKSKAIDQGLIYICKKLLP